MLGAVELLRKSEGHVFKNPDGVESTFKLLPPLTDEELRNLQAQIPCRIPEEMCEIFRCARGFEGVWLETIDFSGLTFSFGMGFGMEKLFPHPVHIAGDGLGNFWTVDLTSGSEKWGPIFYACHDAPVVILQSRCVSDFIVEVLKELEAPWKSEIDDVMERHARTIWRDNPGVISYDQCVASSDADLREFAASLDSSWEFVDLRSCVVGEGFSWGRYGPKTVSKRFGEKRIFACQQRSLGRRILDAFR